MEELEHTIYGTMAERASVCETIVLQHMACKHLVVVMCMQAERMRSAGTVRVVSMSAARGDGVRRLLPAVVEAHTCWTSQ
jgi:hypothetical protein